MKRPVRFCAAALLSVGILSACNGDDTASEEDVNTEPTNGEEDEEEDTVDEDEDDDLDLDLDENDEDDLEEDAIDEDATEEEDADADEDADEEEPVADEAESLEETFDLVFYDDQVLDMYTESHVISGDSQEDLAFNAIERWLQGPDHEELVSVIEDEDVSVQYVEDHDGVAHVSFSPEFTNINIGSGFEIGLMDQVGHIVQQAGFDSVLILIDGESADTLFGHVDSSVPHEPETDLDSYDTMD